MAIRNDHDDYAWAVARNLRRTTASDERDDDLPLPLKEVLAALVALAAGFASIVLMIDALLLAFG